MRYRLSTCVLIGLAALWLTSCSTSRTATRSSERLRVEGVELRDSVEVRRVEVHDTLREVTTITVDRNDKGDTLRQSIVTDRERIRNAADVRSKTVEVRVVRDTVYIEKRDSVSSFRFQDSPSTSSGTSRFVSSLKWIFAILCAIIVLIITVKACLRRSLF